jgi:maltose O-acetyltransferase
MALLRARVSLRKCDLGRRVYAFGRVLVSAEGSIRLGDRCFFVAGILPTELRCLPGARIELGDDTGLAAGVSIEAHESIIIGRRTLVASLVRICDQGPGGTARVVIGSDVWLAHGVIIEPGVSIGDGSVVAAGSVVSRNVPPGHLASGNPARVVPLGLAIRGPGAAPSTPSIEKVTP